jgi:dTDP-4-amino-4,6-dideoxygalactose transaminase
MSDPSAPVQLAPLQFIDLQAQRRRLGSRIDEAMRRVLDHGQFIMGPEVARFEKELAAYTGANHVVSCANGTDALILALKVLGIVPGSAVIVPSFTFAATAEAVAVVGATPVFADVSAESFNLEPQSLDAAAKTARKLGLKPMLVIPVDLFGQPADYDALQEVAESHGIKILADAAQSIGGTRNGRQAGTLAPITTTSFFPAKPLGCYGDGGAIFVEDAGTAGILESLRFHGKGGHKYDNARIGVNSRLDTLQAAILLEKLAIFPEELQARDRVAARYARLLERNAFEGAVRPPRLDAGTTSAWAQYTVVLEDGIDRDSVAQTMKAKGVPTAVYYPLPLHQQTAYRDYPRTEAALATSEGLARSVLALPMHPYLDEPTQERIVNTLLEAIR